MVEIVSYEQPTKYIIQFTQYNHSCKTPVLTAWQSFVVGYMDETDRIHNASKKIQ